MLFVATLLVSVATLIGLAVGADFVNRYGNWFTLVSAGFPALGHGRVRNPLPGRFRR